MINIKYSNITSNERKGFKTVSVPFSPEANKVTAWNAILPDGTTVTPHVVPYGLPRADGSRPYALVTMPIILAANDKPTITLTPKVVQPPSDKEIVIVDVDVENKKPVEVEASAMAAPQPMIKDPRAGQFVYSNNLVSWLTKTSPFLVALKKVNTFVEIPRCGGEELTKESSMHHKTFRFWGTQTDQPIGEAAVSWEMLLTAYSGADYVDYTFTVVAGNEIRNAPFISIEGLYLIFNNLLNLRVDFEETKLSSPRLSEGNLITLPLIEQSVLGDAQGTTISGVFYCPNLAASTPIEMSTYAADMLFPVTAVATNWKESNEFGVLGILLSPLSSLANAPAAVLNKSIEEYSRAPLNTPMAWMDISQQFEQPGLPGRQPGFGFVTLQDIAVTATPERLHVVKRDVQQETCRPKNYMDSTGKWFSVADHPGTWFWNGRPWYRAENNRAEDTLGRKYELADWDVARSQRGIGWMPKDRQHWGIGSDVMYPMLSGDLFARMQLQREIEAWIAAHRVDTTNDTINGLEASRAVGRAFMWAAHAAKVTDDDNLRSRLIATAKARLEKVIQSYAEHYGKDFAIGEVQPFDPLPADSPPVRHNSDLYLHWNPWQESFIPAALHAWSIIFTQLGDTGMASQLKEMAWKLARTITLYGWHNEGGTFVGVSGVQLFESSPGVYRAPSSSELRLGDNYDPYSGYSVWQLNTALLAKKWATERNDEVVVAKAAAIIAPLLSTLPYDPYDPFNYNHDLLNHISVVENPFSI